MPGDRPEQPPRRIPDLFEPLHRAPHPRAGALAVTAGGTTVVIEDWFDRIAGRSWRVADGDPAALAYADRRRRDGLPEDDEVLLVRIAGEETLEIRHDCEL